MKDWIIASQVAGFIPMTVLLASYITRVKWETSLAGRWIVSMLVAVNLTYALNVLVVLFPDLFMNNPGNVIRIVLRFIVAAIFWGLLALFYLAQIGNRRDKRNDHDRT